MLTPDLIRTLLPALLGLPIAAALILRFVGGGQARSVALVFALAHLGLTTAIVFSGMFAVQEGPDVARGTIGRQQRYEESVFAPHFVPGDPLSNGRETHATNLDILPFASVRITTTLNPHIDAEAGLVPWADAGMRQTVRWASPRLW